MLRFIDFYKGIKVVFKKEFTGEQAIKLNNFSKTFYLNVRVTRVIEIFHSLAYSLHGHNGQGRGRPETRKRIFFQFFNV